MQFSKSTLITLFIFCFMGPIALYFQSLKAPLLFDDIEQIVQNKTIQNIETFISDTLAIKPYYDKRYHYRPIVYASLALNYTLGKFNPIGYRIFNILIHILVTFCVFLLTYKIIKQLDPNSSHFFPLCVAIIFTVHPMHTEAVTYIIHREDSLATLFYLTALLSFLSAEKNKTILGYIACISSFILGLLCKEIVFTLPIIIFLMDYFILQSKNYKKILEKKYFYLFLIGITTLFIVLRFFALNWNFNWQKIASETWVPSTYAQIQPYIILNYLQLLLIPIGQSIDHFFTPLNQWFHWKFILPSTFHFLLLSSAIIYYKNNKKYSDLILWGTLWFYITLLPSSSIYPIHDVMADRRVYLPGIGFSIILSTLFFLFFKVNLSENLSDQNSKNKKWMIFTILLYSIILGGFTLYRNHLYNEPYKLWEEAVYLYPQNARAHVNLGNEYAQQEKNQLAIEQYFKAIQLIPTFRIAHMNIGSLYKKLGHQSYQSGEVQRAINFYQQAMWHHPFLPNLYLEIGEIFYAQGNINRAKKFFEKEIEINSNADQARYYLDKIQSQKLK